MKKQVKKPVKSKRANKSPKPKAEVTHLPEGATINPKDVYGFTEGQQEAGQEVEHRRPFARSAASNLASSPVAADVRGVGLNARLATHKAERSAPHVEVQALAGTGKTTTMVRGLMAVRGLDPKITPSEQQQAVWDQLKVGKSDSVRFSAFNSAITKEAEKKLEEAGLTSRGVEAKGVHALGRAAVVNAFPDLRRFNLDNANWVLKDIVAETAGGNWHDLCKNGMREAMNATCKLVDLCKQTLTEPDQEGLDALSSRYDIDFEGASIRQVYELVPQVLDRCKEPRGRYDFNDMIWLPYVHNLSIPKVDLQICDEAQDLNRAQQELVYKAGHRILYVGDRHQCQPAGTMVRVTGRSLPVPIETLKVGDQVVTFNPNGSNFNGKRTQGRKIEAVAKREYIGDMYVINGSRSTPEHKWLTRFRPDVPAEYTALYLVELPDGTYRLGITQLVMGDGRGGFGPAMRARQRKAEKLWVLQVYSTRLEAREAEFKSSMTYRIPQLACYENNEDQWCTDLVQAGVTSDVEGILAHHRLLYDYPIWEKGESQHVGKYSYVTQACNLMVGVNQVCLWKDGSPQWTHLDLDIEADWEGTVYSLKVQPTEGGKRLYVSDNVVTHNSIYGFAGADSESMNRMQETLRASSQGIVTLPLTMTRRCGKAIVAEAQRFVPEFEAHPSNCEGLISRAKYPIQPVGDGTKELAWEQTYGPLLTPGSFVLCRTNAPLVSQCFKLISKGFAATIQGREIGTGLISLISQAKATSVKELVVWLDGWLDQEQEKEIRKKRASESKMQMLADKHQCLTTFCDECGSDESIEVIRRKIGDIFTDDRSMNNKILLSSIHKAKGLEAKRVFFLKPCTARIPFHKLQDWEKVQEKHLDYVAITRAIEELTYVS